MRLTPEPGGPLTSTPSQHSSTSSFLAQRAPQGIPADISSFIGRDREVASLVSLLHRSGVRLVTLAGPPGIGKTRLALRVAESVGGDFAGGASYADLLPAETTAQVTDAIAAARA